ncbi:DEAD/DEAH box helicase [Candidatus Woesearchaeota archaeon]|nr:DEAD/DEAH box helicase [Candidatus Woesearchaeota archaeon]
MLLSELNIDVGVKSVLANCELRPCQEKAVSAGVLDGKSVLVCSPTASGKTLVGELACVKTVYSGKKAVYVVPLIALANEKYRQFQARYSSLFRIGLSSGDLDSLDPALASFDLLVCTAEKLDSLVRHKASWIFDVGCLVVDEIHLLNEPSRGPVLEVVITLLRSLLPKLQIVGLSATIGNPEELAGWLGAALVKDSWRPVPLHQGVYLEGKLDFFK